MTDDRKIDFDYEIDNIQPASIIAYQGLYSVSYYFGKCTDCWKQHLINSFVRRFESQGCVADGRIDGEWVHCYIQTRFD